MGQVSPLSSFILIWAKVIMIKTVSFDDYSDWLQLYSSILLEVLCRQQLFVLGPELLFAIF